MSDIKTSLKALFRSGAIPSERDFAKLIDSMVSTDDLDSAMASLRDGSAQSPGQDDARRGDADRRDEDIAILRHERKELEERLDREIAALRGERDAIEPLLRRKDVAHRQEMEAASSFLEDKISALKDERRTVRDRQDRGIDALRRGLESNGRPLPRTDLRPPAPTAPPMAKRQVPADGAWHPLEIEPRTGAFSIVATMNSPANVAATQARVVAAGPTYKPAVSTRTCCDRGWWVLLVPIGVVAIGVGAILVRTHGVSVWREPWSAAGLWLALVGLATIIVGVILHRRRALSIAWRRDGFLTRKSPGVFRLRSNGRFMDGGTIQSITYVVSVVDA